jgi:hypothetical protein
MSKDRFLIAPIKEGFRTDAKPWQIPEDSFERLENAYVYQGNVIKRFGSRYTGTGAAAGFESMNSRLRVPLKGAGVGITDGAGAATGTVPGGGYAQPGQMFSIGTAYYTVGATGAMIPYNNISSTHTYNTTTGVYNFIGAAATTQIYFYPGDPVMGLFNYETGVIHNRPVLAADTRLIYQYNGTAWDAIGPLTGGGAYDPFTGDNANFFHMASWMGTQFYNTYLFVTNFVAADGMWYWDGTTWTAWTPKFLVAGAATRNVVNTARIIVPFKDRLLLLNTVETDTGGTQRTYQNRCRYSHNGSPLDASAWYEINEVGYTGGGWIEAPTEEEIISASFIKDRLIVLFERSTWELAYTGDQVQPFVWQKINTELGCESPQSTVPFDKVILTVGTTGIHACNGSNVERIDTEIHDEVFKIRNTEDGPFRVGGIRDYIKEMVYWTIPYIVDGEYAEVFPNKVLVYNYDNGTWALNDDTITVFGYLEQQVGPTWATAFDTWAEALYDWTEGVIAPQPIQVIAGNQQGYVFLIDTDRAVNEAVMQISNATLAVGVVTLTIVNHNLKNGDIIKIEHCQGSTELNGNNYEVSVVNANTVQIIQAALTAYEGLGVVALVSRVDILTKQFNPYISKGMNVSIEKVEFAVERTDNGQLDVQYFASSSDVDLTAGAIVSGAILGDFVLDCFPYTDIYPLEATQKLLWHPIYFQSSGEFIQIRLYYSNDVMLTNNIVEEGFSLEGIALYTTPTGRLQ